MVLAATRKVIMSSSMMFDLMCLYEVFPESRAKARVLSIINHFYIHSFRSTTEATEKLKQ